MEKTKLGMVLLALVLALGMAFALDAQATATSTAGLSVAGAVAASADAATTSPAIGCPANAIPVKCEDSSADPASRTWVGKDGCYYTCASAAQCKDPAPVKCESGQQYKYTDKNGCTMIGCRAGTTACPAMQEAKCEGTQYKYTDKNGCTAIGCKPNRAACSDPAIPSCTDGAELYKYTDPAGCTQVACRHVENEGVGVRLNAQSEVKKGDSFKVSAAISYSSSESEDSAHRYKVVTHFDQYGQQNAAEAGSNADRANSRQERVDYITLGAGESTEVSTYFTAPKAGVHVVSVDVYRSSSDCDPRSMRAVACPEGTYNTIVGQAAAKVRVVGETSPPPQPSNVEGTIVLHKGWNLVSVPVMERVSMAKVASECGSANYAWKYNVNYQQVESLEPGVGYWIYSTNGDCKFPVQGKAYTTDLAPLNAGWNLIGAPGNSVSLADYSGNCKVTAGPWAYGAANSAAETASPYSYSSTLEPGMGYWLKVESSCKLGSTLGQPPQPPA